MMRFRHCVKSLSEERSLLEKPGHVGDEKRNYDFVSVANMAALHTCAYQYHYNLATTGDL